MTDLHQLSACAAAALIRRGELSSEEAVTAALDRIADLDPYLHAFITVDPELALRTARQVDEITDPAAKGPLHGVPIAVKDVTDVAGFPTTHGSLSTSRLPAATDDPAIARLRAAGAVIVGKTNTPEFGFGAVCTNELAGATRNPWDEARTSGGSSGGSAVAVTTGMVALAQGTDLGGSVRTPASFCGCYGLRPTAGSIAEPGRLLGWGPLASQGLLARSVDDIMLMLDVMAGPDSLDPASRPYPAPVSDSGPLRIAASADLGGSFRVDPAVRTAFGNTVEAMSGIFATVEEASPAMDGAIAAFEVLRAAEAWHSYGRLLGRSDVEVSESVRWNVQRGATIGADQYLAAQQVRTDVYRRAIRFFDRYDVLVLPAASVLPFPIDQAEVRLIDGEPTTSIIEYLACTFLISLIGFPVLSVPAAHTDSGLPFGVQLVGLPGHESLLARVARDLAENGEFSHQWPTDRGRSS